MTDSYPEPGEWEVIDRNKLVTKYEHADGATAKVVYSARSLSLVINGDGVFEITNPRSDRSEFWEKVELALEGWPDNVDAHKRVGNAGLGDFCE